jgi:hypothetical protein
MGTGTEVWGVILGGANLLVSRTRMRLRTTLTPAICCQPERCQARKPGLRRTALGQALAPDVAGKQEGVGLESLTCVVYRPVRPLLIGRKAKAR